MNHSSQVTAEALRRDSEHRQKDRGKGFFEVVREIWRHRPRRISARDKGPSRAKGQQMQG